MRHGVMLNRWLWLSALVIVLDQLSKAWIANHFFLGESYTVFSVFNLVLAHNTGAAFSFLNNAGGIQRWLFSIIAIFASVLIIWLLRKHAKQTLFAFALSLILGGALGNLIDRVVYGYVVDFLSFHWDEHYFPAFNLADSAITCGAFLLILDSFKEKKHGTTAG
ncbi:MAG TPA: signal peptidase II [Gallionella sp.]|nr:signal peptidase II [Gallionella sp.]